MMETTMARAARERLTKTLLKNQRTKLGSPQRSSSLPLSRRAGRAGGHGGEGRAREAHEDAVEEPAHEVGLPEEQLVVAHVEALRQDVYRDREDLVALLEGGADHVQVGHDQQEDRHEQDGVARYLPEPDLHLVADHYSYPLPTRTCGPRGSGPPPAPRR